MLLFTVDDTLPTPAPVAAPAPATTAGAVGAETRTAMSVAWGRWALAGILLLSALLGAVRIDNQGLGNAYYAATVKSMLLSWSNFFFVSFDPGGFVSVDKPPVGYWIQAASAWLLGFSGPALLLPQVAAAVGSVAILFATVRRVFGLQAGLLAALALALTPVTVATSRNNTVDVTLLLLLLGAAWALLRAADRGSLRWLLLAAGLVGVGFNVKMLQAYLVVPAFWLVYLLGAQIRWPKRLGHLAIASVVLLLVSLSWAIAVDLTPATARPYVGSSFNNSVLDLIVGYNGLARLLPLDMLGSVTGVGSALPMLNMGTNPEIGAAGLLRLFNPQLAGQIAWLLPLALVGLVVAWVQEPTRLPLGPRHRSLLLWAGWLLTGVAFFSFGSLFHRHYLVMLAPPIAALVGAGAAALWADYRRPTAGWRGWLLPAALAAAAVFHAAILAPTPDWAARLTPVILLLGLGSAAALVVLRARPRLAGRFAAAAATAGLVSVLLGPGTWSAIAAWEGTSNVLPAGGPNTGFAGFALPAAGGTAPGGVANGVSSGDAANGVPNGNAAGTPGAGGMAAVAPPPGPNSLDLYGAADPKLVAYLEENRDGSRFLLATANASAAAPYILATGEPVAALGGFIGADPILTDDEFAAMVAAGEVRFVLAPSREQSEQMAAAVGPAIAAFSGNTDWVNAQCAEVPADQWRSEEFSGGMLGRLNILFDCAPR
jgi:4-amino-4-deoxy-L-arabinose transferase-like glycosyltransferase